MVLTVREQIQDIIGRSGTRQTGNITPSSSFMLMLGVVDVDRMYYVDRCSVYAVDCS